MNTFTEAQLTWLTTLEAGTYKQTAGVLEALGDNGFCCLGVACNTLAPEIRHQTDLRINYGDSCMCLPQVMVEKLDMRDSDGTIIDGFIGYLDADGEPREVSSLMDANDDHGFTFTQIAAMIRLFPWVFFTNFDKTYTPPAEALKGLGEFDQMKLEQGDAAE